jgi:hypothetical protein
MIIVIFMALLAAGSSNPQVSPPVLDGVEASRLTGVSYSFNCADTRTRVSYTQERKRRREGQKLEDGYAVSLEKLSVARVRIPRREMAAAETLFRTFAWIEHIDARCYAGTVLIHVKGMRLTSWVAYVLDRSAELPDLETGIIRVSAEGKIEILD